MSRVTVELGALLSRTDFKLFDFEYQLDDPNFKAQLEQRIIDYYYDYEIGAETPDMFKRKFKARFLRAIPYYNELYNTTLLEYNPLINSKMSEALDQLAQSSQTDNTASTSSSDTTTTDNATQNQTGTTSTVGNQKASDYPQQPIATSGFLAGEEDSTSTTDSENDTTSSASGTSNTDATNDSTTTSSGQTDTSYTKTIEGLTGMTYQDLIRKERENLLRIPNMLIEELKPCFIMIY